MSARNPTSAPATSATHTSNSTSSTSRTKGSTLSRGCAIIGMLGTDWVRTCQNSSARASASAGVARRIEASAWIGRSAPMALIPGEAAGDRLP